MKQFLLFIAIIPVVLIVATEFSKKPDQAMTEREKLMDTLNDMTFNRPERITVLIDETTVDKKARERVRTLVLKTNEEYVPKSQRRKSSTDAVLKLLKEKLPEYEFGEIVNSEASFFHLLSPRAEWAVSSLETNKGFYSRWESREDFHSITNQ